MKPIRTLALIAVLALAPTLAHAEYHAKPIGRWTLTGAATVTCSSQARCYAHNTEISLVRAGHPDWSYAEQTGDRGQYTFNGLHSGTWYLNLNLRDARGNTCSRKIYVKKTSRIDINCDTGIRRKSPEPEPR